MNDTEITSEMARLRSIREDIARARFEQRDDDRLIEHQRESLARLVALTGRESVDLLQEAGR